MPRRARSPLTSVAEEWIGGILPLPLLVTGEGPAYHPSLVVWVDRDGMFILKGDSVRPGEEPAALCCGASLMA